MRKVLILLVGCLLLWTVSAAGESFKYLITELEPIPHSSTETWESWANAINNRNEIAGVSTKKSSYINHATLWQYAGGEWGTTDLGNLGGLQGSTALGVNDLGVVAGYLVLPGKDPVQAPQDVVTGG